VRRRTLPAYLRRRVGTQVLALLAILTAMQQLLELLDVTTDILERELGWRGLLYYAFLRTPAELVLALPLAALLGTMTALYPMARSLEITALRASGVSLARLGAHLLPLALALGLAQFALAQLALPWTETTLKQWWSATAPPPTEEPAPLWANTSGGPVSIDGASADGRVLRGVRVYRRDANGLVTARLQAASARWDGRRWELSEVAELKIESGRVERTRSATREWQTNLRPEEVMRLDVARPYLSSMMLVDVIAGSRVGAQPLSYYRTALYRSFLSPLGVVVMVLLALPVASMLPRAGRTGGQLPVALVLGLAYLLGDGLAAALGSSGRLPPLAMALAAPLSFTLIGLLRLCACDR
jgi:lipopolysaccharide export system permease protein